jgi:hypothetical protein
MRTVATISVISQRASHPFNMLSSEPKHQYYHSVPVLGIDFSPANCGRFWGPQPNSAKIWYCEIRDLEQMALVSSEAYRGAWGFESRSTGRRCEKVRPDNECLQIVFVLKYLELGVFLHDPTAE